MNFFIKTKIWIWILAGLLIISWSVLGSMIYHTWTEPEPAMPQPSGCNGSCMMLFGELGLDTGQQAAMDQILDQFRDSSTVLVTSMRNLRLLLLNELEKENPDSLQLVHLSEELGDIQTRMIQISAEQYLQIRSICNPSQQQSLSNVYYQLFGCRGPEGSQGMKQEHNRHRHGQHPE